MERARFRFRVVASTSSSRAAVPLLLALGGVASAVLVAREIAWSVTAGPGDGVAGWPPSSRLPLPDSAPWALVFLHPQCSCSAATLEAVARLVGLCEDRIDWTLVVRADSEDPGFAARGGLTRRISRLVEGLHNVDRFVDENGREAGRFGVGTSGHTFLFAAGTYELIAQGGLTPTRGHFGETSMWGAICRSAGVSRSEAERRAALDGTLDSPVFGCEIEPVTVETRVGDLARPLEAVR